MISTHAAGLAFDALAPTYDTEFTQTHIGQAQRSAVLSSALRTFAGRQHILELNCGTGEDASRLATCGWNVLALDASEQMIGVASRRCTDLQETGSLRFRILPTEEIASLNESFDAVFSNFSGLNCVSDLTAVAESLSQLTTAGSPIVLCLSTRFCAWEALRYSLTLQPGKAARRWSGRARATLRGHSLTVYYPLLREIKAAFKPHFHLERIQAIGLFVPPSYLERHIARIPRLLTLFKSLDSALSRLPVLRILGDHMLLTLRKTE